jgi:monoamine oxidase
LESIEADVCVVGAGYAGLTAARRLAQAGRTAVVLEARDRVGGRVWTRHMEDGTALDLGGTWLGPGQDAAYGLARELAVTTYPTYAAGDTVFVSARGQVSRYRGAIPKIGPLPIVSLAQGMFRLDAMARSVSIEEPWNSKRARSWDARSAGHWIDAQVPTITAKQLLRAAVRGLLTADPSEISLLNLLYLIRSAGGLNSLLSVEGGYQQDRVSGGAQAMADRMAGDLGDALRLESPVTDVLQDHDGVIVRGANVEVLAKRAIVTIPPALAARVRYDPPLPPDRRQLLDRMPAGAMIKVLTVYEDAFWRTDGLSGMSVGMNSAIEMTLDASPESARPGILASFAFGPLARSLARQAPDERRLVVLDALRARFGQRAGEPILYEEHDWEREEWTRGCSLSHIATACSRSTARRCARRQAASTGPARKRRPSITARSTVRSGRASAPRARCSRRSAERSSAGDRAPAGRFGGPGASQARNRADTSPSPPAATMIVSPRVHGQGRPRPALAVFRIFAAS